MFKKWRAGEKKFKEKEIVWVGLDVDPRLAGDWVDAKPYPHCSLFFEFFLFLEVWGMGQGIWENGCTTPPFL
jgi:hypothetical protein